MLPRRCGSVLSSLIFFLGAVVGKMNLSSFSAFSSLSDEFMLDKIAGSIQREAHEDV